MDKPSWQEEPGSAPLLTRHTTQESVVGYLRKLILSRQLKAGERLVQNDLARALGVSRTPIREALHTLASEGLVTISAYKGASVTAFSLRELKEIYSIRIALESYAAYLAAQDITAEDLQKLEAAVHQMKETYRRGDRAALLEINRKFYSILYAIPNQERLYTMIMKHLDLAHVYRRMAFALGSEQKRTVVDHEALLQALKRRDAEAVERLTRVGLQETADALVRFLQETGDAKPRPSA